MPTFLGYCAQECSPKNAVDDWLQSRCGGLPGWLNPESVPTDTYCRYCNNSLVFLCQIYSPSEKGFHRMIYILSCWSCGKDVKAYRAMANQLNDWLPPQPEDDSDHIPRLTTQLRKSCCQVCLLPVQEVEDKQPVHLRCKNHLAGHSDQSSVLPRSDIWIEEEAPRKCLVETVEEEVKGPVREMSKVPEINQDPTLDAYINYMESMPSHIIRYGAANPLWFCSSGICADVPSCEACGAPRKFEFQVQSSLLSTLNILTNLELAFGILAVYTCSNDCDARGSVPEFVHKQRDPTVDVRIRLREIDQ